MLQKRGSVHRIEHKLLGLRFLSYILSYANVTFVSLGFLFQFLSLNKNCFIYFLTGDGQSRMHLVIRLKRPKSARASAKGQPLPDVGKSYEKTGSRSRLVRTSHCRDHAHHFEFESRLGSESRIVQDHPRKKSSGFRTVGVQGQSQETQFTAVSLFLYFTLGGIHYDVTQI